MGLRGHARDAGAAAVLVVALLAVGGALLVTVALVAGAHAARGSAQAGADLAALAAATQHVRAGSGACDVGSQAAARNDVELTACTVLPDGSVVVTVRREFGAFAALGAGAVEGRARAGPAWLRADADGAPG